MKPITTTLAAIRKHSPCEDGWEKLLKHLGKTKADNKPLKFSTILESNGLDDALWCLRSISPEYDKEIRLLACDYAERVLHLYEEKYPNDDRPRKAIETARKYAKGKATKKQLDAAWDAAWAAGDAARAARAAAWDAAWAAWDAARAARAAARDAAWDAAWDARDAAGAAERKIQAKLLVKYFG